MIDILILKEGDTTSLPDGSDPAETVFVGTRIAIGKRPDGTEFTIDLRNRVIVPPPPGPSPIDVPIDIVVTRGRPGTFVIDASTLAASLQRRGTVTITLEPATVQDVDSQGPFMKARWAWR